MIYFLRVKRKIIKKVKFTRLCAAKAGGGRGGGEVAMFLAQRATEEAVGLRWGMGAGVIGIKGLELCPNFDSRVTFKKITSLPS